ncbi:hypothetical protein C0J52_02907, partial [Blattella germanica]
KKKAVRILANANFLEHCKPLFIKLEVLTVINLFIYDVLLYTLNNMNNYNLVSTIHNHNTRNNKNILVPYTRLSKTVNSHMIMGMKIYNIIPKQYFDLPLECFKKRFYRWMLKNPFYATDEFFLSERDTNVNCCIIQ